MDLLHVWMFKYLLANVLFPLLAGDGCQAYQSNLQCYILWSCYHSPPLQLHSHSPHQGQTGILCNKNYWLASDQHLFSFHFIPANTYSVQIDSSLLYIGCNGWRCGFILQCIRPQTSRNRNLRETQSSLAGAGLGEGGGKLMPAI